MTLSKYDPGDPVGLTVEIVSAFVAHNSLPRNALPALLLSVHGALTKKAGGADAAKLAAQAARVRKSVTPGYLICLDDGRKLKSLRRHLAALGMTPDQYRAKWELPSDYPMVASNYTAQRSALAKKIGFGHFRKGGGANGKPR